MPFVTIVQVNDSQMYSMALWKIFLKASILSGHLQPKVMSAGGIHKVTATEGM